MMKLLYPFIASLVLVSCSGPSYFNGPAAFVGGNRAAAVETHCARQAGEGKDSLLYKVCQQSFTNHYGK